MAGKRQVSPEQEQAILALYAEGLTREEVAAATGVSDATVTRVHAAHNVPMRPRGGPSNATHLAPVEYEKTVALYQAGYSEPEIAEVLGISRSAVAWRLAECGVEKRTIRESLALRDTDRVPAELVLRQFSNR